MERTDRTLQCAAQQRTTRSKRKSHRTRVSSDTILAHRGPAKSSTTHRRKARAPRAAAKAKPSHESDKSKDAKHERSTSLWQPPLKHRSRVDILNNAFAPLAMNPNSSSPASARHERPAPNFKMKRHSTILLAVYFAIKMSSGNCFCLLFG